jgi:protein-tyrosine-phosphatase/predicted ATP-grasp superfamily ATP-dependent carboligase
MKTNSRCALVLDGHSRAAIETLQALGRHGVEVDIAADKDCAAFHSKYARQRIIQPPANDPHRLAEWIAEQDARWEYRLIVASTEFSLQAFRLLPDENPVRVKALLPGNESLNTALNKQKTCELASRLGIPVPRTILIEAASKLPIVERYPVVLKPTQSTQVTSESTVTVAPEIVKNESERAVVLEAWLPHVAVQQQEYIAGRGLGIEFLFNQGQRVWHFAHERIHEYPLTGGGSTYRRSVHADPALLEQAQELLAALRWHGVAMVEFKVGRDGSYYLMEINPRFWGSLALSIDAGVDFPLGLWRIANSDRLSPQPDYKVPYYTRDLANDLQWQAENLTADHRDVMLLTRPRVRPVVEYLRPLLGKESWDHFDRRDLKLTWEILGTIGRKYFKAVRSKLKGRMTESKIVFMHRQAVRNMGRRTTPVRSLLFLCHGNICRSPVAQRVAKQVLTNLEVESAGLHAQEGRRSPGNIISAANRIGIDLVHSGSRCVTKQQIKRADLVFVMDVKNYGDLIGQYPEAASRTLLLGLFLERPAVNIPDPYRASDEKAWEVVDQISRAINAFARKLHKSLPDESRA